jgi:aminoglycoside phosphotransferase (APT) family kinase protein
MTAGRTPRKDSDVMAGLRSWASVLGPGKLTVHGPPSGAGNSSETILFDVGTEPFVLRLPPAADAFPLFPVYDLARQARVLELVASRSAVPVPKVRACVLDPAVLGDPFLVMERVDGHPAPDNPPYVFGSWLTEATLDERDMVEAGMVEVLAGIHALGDVPEMALEAPGATALRRHVEHWRMYHRWIVEQAETDFPVIDEAFDWLERRWPDDEGPAVLSWGDARLANVLFREFRPVAVLDWEAVAVGPREVDLGWCVFFHDYFQRVAVRFGHVGMPDFFERSRVVTAYEAVSGHTVRDFDWYLVYAELRQALTSIRVSARAVWRGERPPPDDSQDLIMDRQHLEEIIRT